MVAARVAVLALVALAQPAAFALVAASSTQGYTDGCDRALEAQLKFRCPSSRHMFGDEEVQARDTAVKLGAVAVGAREDCIRERHRFYEQGGGTAKAPQPPVEAAAAAPTPSPARRGAGGPIMGLAALTAEAFGEQGQPRVPVPAHDGCMSPKRWAELHAQGRPYLLRGCLAETSPRVVESWDDGYLLRHAGAQVDGKNRETLGEFLTQPQLGDKEYLTFMNLSQALLEDVGMPAPLLEKHKTHYDKTVANLLRALLGDVGVPAPLRDESIARYDKTVLWLAREGWKTGRQSLLHFDPNDNLLHLAFGTKHVLLASPAESAALYSDYAKAEGNSPIDATAVDLSRFPLAASATLHVADMREGDILFIPSNWWHLVTSHPLQRHLALAVQFDIHGRRYAPCRSWNGFSEARVEGQLLREREGKAFVSGLSDHRVPAGAHPSIKGVLLSQNEENERDERDGDFHDEDSRDEEL